MPDRRLVLAAVAAASLASCRGGCARNAADTKGSEPTADATDSRLALIPAEAGMVTIVDVAKLRDAPILTNLVRGKATDIQEVAAMMVSAEAGLRDYVKESGFHPIRDVDTVILATAAGEQAGGGAVIRGRHLDEKRLVASIRKLKGKDGELIASKHGAHTLWSPRAQASVAAIVLDDRTLLVGSRDWTERMADLADGVGSGRSAATNADLVRLLRTVSGHAIAGVSLEPKHLSFLDRSDAGAGAAADVRHATCSVDAGQRFSVAANVELTSPAAATAAARRWTEKLKDPKLAAMVSVRAEGSKFLLDADIDQERLRMLVLLGAMFASFPLVHVD